MASSLSAAEFVEVHQALLVKHARSTLRLPQDERAAPLPPEDVTAELVRLLEDVEGSGVDLGSLTSPDAYLRRCLPVATSRARRRRTLLEQVTAGDDLSAVSSDIKSVDAELPPPPEPDSDASREARKKLDAIHSGLRPHDALVLALVVDDERGVEGAALALTQSAEDTQASFARAISLARELGTCGEEGKKASDERLRELLVALARHARDPEAKDRHVDEPVLALVRGGDLGDDLADALAHVAKCVDCRARVAEGETTQHSVIVMAIDAGAQKDVVVRAAEEAHARLLPRGDGRFTAIIQSDNLVSFKAKLSEAAVARVAVAGQVDIPVARRRAPSLVDATEAGGIDAAELRAWADIGKVAAAPKPAAPGLPRWAMVAAVVGVAVVSAALALVLSAR